MGLFLVLFIENGFVAKEMKREGLYPYSKNEEKYSQKTIKTKQNKQKIKIQKPSMFRGAYHIQNNEAARKAANLHPGLFLIFILFFFFVFLLSFLSFNYLYFSGVYGVGAALHSLTRRETTKLPFLAKALRFIFRK